MMAHKRRHQRFQKRISSRWLSMNGGTYPFMNVSVVDDVR